MARRLCPLELASRNRPVRSETRIGSSSRFRKLANEVSGRDSLAGNSTMGLRFNGLTSDTHAFQMNRSTSLDLLRFISGEPRRILSKWMVGVNGKWVLLCTYMGNHFPQVVQIAVENKFYTKAHAYNMFIICYLAGYRFFIYRGRRLAPNLTVLGRKYY